MPTPIRKLFAFGIILILGFGRPGQIAGKKSWSRSGITSAIALVQITVDMTGAYNSKSSLAVLMSAWYLTRRGPKRSAAKVGGRAVSTAGHSRKHSHSVVSGVVR